MFNQLYAMIFFFKNSPWTNVRTLDFNYSVFELSKNATDQSIIRTIIIHSAD
jgi:hypothetical protein